MSILIKILDLAALIVQLVGSWIMFKNSPENKPNGVFVGSENPDYKQSIKKNLKLKRGFLILGVEFFLALISLLLKTLVPTHI